MSDDGPSWAEWDDHVRLTHEVIGQRDNAVEASCQLMVELIDAKMALAAAAEREAASWLNNYQGRVRLERGQWNAAGTAVP